jgi:hypothetical protein
MADEGKKKYNADELQRWLIEKAEQAKSPDIARKTILSNEQRGRSTTILGRLYFFKYSPIGRYTLPKYDRFPMCVPIERYNNGFLGLNLHYLPAGSRLSLIQMMLSTRNAFETSDVTVMKINYQMIKAINKLNTLATPCIHRYVFNQVRSKFIEIYPSEYDKAIQLPVEDWVFNS